MIEVKTPFGIGYASDIEDLKKMTEFLEPYYKEYELLKAKEEEESKEEIIELIKELL